MELNRGIHLPLKQIMKTQLIAFALALFFFQGAVAQNFGEIHGTVIDDEGQPMYGVAVVAMNGATLIGDITNDLGKFKIKPLPPGVYSLKYTYPGMAETTLERVEVDPEEITFIPAIQLQYVKYGPVIIPEFKDPLIDPEETSKITMRAADLKNMSSMKGGNIAAVVKSISSDVKTDRNGELYFRGSRAGNMLYFVDGVKVSGSTMKIPASGVSAISVYTGGLPAKYGDTIGGVVVIETKSYLEDYYAKINR